MTQADYKHRFLQACVDYGALRFGEFTLKSGRVSPYFFNAGAFNDGQAFRLLGECYAQAIEGVQFDGLFGPAYKGIPLATALSVTLAEAGRNVPVTFNRKEAKDHGEGGVLMGAQPQGRILLVDDVITAGTAVRQAMAQLDGVDVGALVVALDRQERGQGSTSAIQELRAEGLEVRTIVTLDDVLEFARATQSAENVASMVDYRATYGV
ncbi:MAG: orotate phosphoribosyltransferase [Litorivicinus sp.]